MTSFCNDVNKFGKGIGNAARYRIVQALLGSPKTVNEITAVVKLSQPAVSQHLKTLRECNIVTDERHGQEVFYTVNTEHTLYLLKHLLVDMKKKPDTRSSKRKSIKK